MNKYINKKYINKIKTCGWFYAAARSTLAPKNIEKEERKGFLLVTVSYNQSCNAKTASYN